MAIIIETCPKCGHDLVYTVICTNPPIPKKGCPNCGWSLEGEPEEVVRVPFGGNLFYPDDSCCSLNNINGHAFVTTSNLSNDTINYEMLVESIERAMKYRDNRNIKQGF